MLRIVNVVIAMILLGSIAPAQPASQPSSPAGIWLGSLNAGGRELRLLVKLDWYSDRGWGGTLNSLDQTAVENKLQSVEVNGNKVRFAIHKRAYFEGELSADATSMQGTWNQNGSLPLTFARQEKAPEITRPQDPKPPFPYDAREVSFDNPAAKATFSGMLTVPKTGGPHPAVVLISGSGPQNRDEECFGHRPFAVLADHLTRNGIAVLRHDDRGVGKSTGDRSKATSVDYADDALAAVAFLKTQSDIDPKRIGLVGHSEGGSIAPIAAAKSNDVAFIVLMAGPGIRGKELLVAQNRLILTAAGAPASMVDVRVAVAARTMQAAMDEADDAKVLEQAKVIFNQELAKQPPLVKAVIESQGDASELATELCKPWMRYFLSYDPGPTLAKVKCPVLAIAGEKDVQVPAKDNLTAIDKAVRGGGNDRVTIKEMPGLNHLFQPAKTGAIDEYATIDQTIAPAALEEISAWIRTTCGM